MYSHDLQTCDWPRNVGCELADTSSERNLAQSQVQRQREPHAQHVPSRVRFGAAFSSQGGTQKTATVPPQYHRSPPQVIQAQVQNIPPPPPELRVSPNPVITSRGQPKPLIDSQEDIAKVTQKNMNSKTNWGFILGDHSFNSPNSYNIIEKKII